MLLATGFALLVGAAMHVQCGDGGITLAMSAVADAKPCLNGSVGYLPALGALIVIGMLLVERHHRAGPYVVWGAAIFAISIVFRSVDLSFCDQVVIDGRNVGTHFIWHLLNALVLFLLLRASLEAGPVGAVPAVAQPKPEAPEPPAAAPVEAVPAKNEIKESPEVASAGEAAADEAAEEPKDEEPEAKDEDPGAEDEAPEAEEPDTEKDEPEDEAKDEPEAKKGRAKKKPSFPA